MSSILLHLQVSSPILSVLHNEGTVDLRSCPSLLTDDVDPLRYYTGGLTTALGLQEGQENTPGRDGD